MRNWAGAVCLCRFVEITTFQRKIVQRPKKDFPNVAGFIASKRSTRGGYEDCISLNALHSPNEVKSVMLFLCARNAHHFCPTRPCMSRSPPAHARLGRSPSLHLASPPTQPRRCCHVFCACDQSARSTRGNDSKLN